MDESFFLRAKRLLEQRRPVQLDHDALIEAIRARQDACPTASAASLCGDGAEAGDDPQAICTLLRAEEHWRHAVQIQRGCFNRAVAARPVKGP